MVAKKSSAAKAKSPAKAKSGTEPTGTANMAAGAAEQNVKNVPGADSKASVDAKAKKPKSIEERLSALETAHDEHRDLARRNGWSI